MERSIVKFSCLMVHVFLSVFYLTTDGHPVMAAGSPCGHIGLWDLEDKKLINQMRNAHSTAIAGLTFLHREPLLVTNGADNALRVLWLLPPSFGLLQACFNVSA